MVQSDVATIIINWNLKEETLMCIRSVEQSAHPCRIIVVDNGSHDGSVEYLSLHAPQVELIALPLNYGFGRACNIAIAHALTDRGCQYVFLLNNDAVVHTQAITELRDAAEYHSQAGILGCKIYYRDCPTTFWYAGARRRRYVLAAADIGRGQMDQGQFDRRHAVDYIFGAAMFVRREVFENIGCFDEQFFLYLEDLDFCLMAQQAGFALRFVPSAYIWHSVSASTHHNPGMRRYHMVKSTIYFLQKHTTPARFPLVLLFWSFVYARFLFGDMLRGHSSTLRQYWLGLLHGLREVWGGRRESTCCEQDVYLDINATIFKPE
jgi:GT2 family glycosyltransferase